MIAPRPTTTSVLLLAAQICCVATVVGGGGGGGEIPSQISTTSIDLAFSAPRILVVADFDDAQREGLPFAFTTPVRNSRVFFRDEGISIVHYGGAHSSIMASESRLPSDAAWMHRVDMNLRGAQVQRIELFDLVDEAYNAYSPVYAAGSAVVSTGVRYIDVWPGIDVEYMLNSDGLKYQFIVHPGGNPSNIVLTMNGAGRTRRMTCGGIRYSPGRWSLTDAAPVVFQQDEFQTPVAAEWVLREDQLSFRLGEYNTHATLVIDPFLQWSTFLGGELADYARDVAVDTDGNTYVCGFTASTRFPVTPGAMQSTPAGNFDLFIAKFSRDGKRVWTTLFGGSGSEENPRIAISPLGDIVVAGSTSSNDLPVSAGAHQTRNNGKYDVFVLSLDVSGQRRWCTYYGGSFSDECGGLAIDGNGRIHVVGGSYSTNFPVTPDAIQTSNAGDFDMFVIRFNADGAREWATYLGGWSMDYASDIAVTTTGDMFVTGRTESTNFPAVNTGMQSVYGGGAFDAFLVRIDGKTRKITWCTYLGGEMEDAGERVAVDAKGNVLVTGYTASHRFPMKSYTFRPRNAGLMDIFLASFAGTGDLNWSTYLGGNEVDKATGLDIDEHGNIFLTGFTGSRNFPTVGASLQEKKDEGYDAVIAQFSSSGACLWSTFYGGEGHDISHGLALDAKGNVVIVGGTESREFRTIGNPFQNQLAGLTDAFILRVIFDMPMADAGVDTTICSGTSVTLSGSAGGGRAPYRFSWTPAEGISQATAQQAHVTPTRTTAYTLTVTDSEGAVSRDTVTITVVPLPVADAGPDLALCPGSGGSLQGRASGGTGPYVFSWSPADGLAYPERPSTLVTPSQTTTYVLSVTDAKGCVSRDSVRVLVHPRVSIDAGGDRIVCANVPIRLSVAASGGKTPYRYSWSPSEGMTDPSSDKPHFTPRVSSTLVATVTDANGCIARDTIHLTVHQPPVVDAGDAMSLCAGEKGTMKARISGGKAPYTVRWTPGDGLSSTQTISPSVTLERSAMYMLTVTDANGCVVTDSVGVSVHARPELVLEGEVYSCAGTPIQIGSEARGGTPPYTYSWSPTAGLDDATSAMPFATPRQSTTYTVNVVDANGCKARAMVKVLVQPRPTLQVRDRASLCRGAAVTLSASARGGRAPLTWSWTPVDGLSDPTIPNPLASPSITTTYTVAVRDAAGCIVSERVEVTVLEAPRVHAGEDVSICTGTPAVLNATLAGGRQPYRYTWSPATGLSSIRTLTPTASPNRTTMYTLTVTDANGCVGMDTVTVYVSPPPVANAGADVRMCAGSESPIGEFATGGRPPYSYQWTPSTGLSDPNIATPIASPATTTQYTLTVTDAGGCSVSDNVTVHVYALPLISLPREITICRGQGAKLELSVTGGGKALRYEWTPREGLSNGTIANPIAAPVQTTTYTVTVIDPNGCRVSAVVTVTVQPCNKADAGEDMELCSGERVRIGARDADTSYNAVFSWLPVQGLDDATAAAPIAFPEVTTRYILTVRNSFGCVSRDTVRLRVSPSPNITASDDATICHGGEATLSARITGGTQPYRTIWVPETGLSNPEALRTSARPVATTLYTVTVTDARGCIATDSVLVTLAPPLTMSMPRTASACRDDEVQLGGEIRGGTPPYRFFWSPPEGLDDRNASRPTAVAQRSMIYTVTLSDANGCKLVDTVRVDVLERPIVTLSPSTQQDICEGQTVTLQANPGYARYLWSNMRESARIEIQEEGEYNVTAWNEHGCSNMSESVLIRVFPRPKPSISAFGPLSFCEGDSVLLDAGAGYLHYRWSTGAEARMLTATVSGTYTVTVTGQGGCEATSPPVNVTVFPKPLASITQRVDTLIAWSAETYQWYRNENVLPGAVSRTLIADRSGDYSVLVGDRNNCTSMSEKKRLEFADVTIALPAIAAKTGDTVDVPINLVRGDGFPTRSRATLVIRVKKKTLRVISGATDGFEAGEYLRIRIDSLFTGGDTLATIRVVILDIGEPTPLILERVHWHDSLITSTLRHGEIRHAHE